VRDSTGREIAVECCRSSLRAAPDPARLAEAESIGASANDLATRLPVGLSLSRTSVCVAYDAPLRIAVRALETETSAYGVPVVDERWRIVGILPRARVALALLEAQRDTTAELMASDWCAIEEDRSFHGAFETMSARHARELAVVNEHRVLVGTLRDIDALLFVAHVARTGLRPSLPRAA
jgi:predicted transcriptional regulator